jgi:hypothetical protein
MMWLLLYLGVSLVFVARTQLELASKKSALGWRIGGAMLCLIWPVIVVLVFAEVLRHRGGLSQR